MTLEIWHNPRCSKSRAALAIIQDAGVRHRVRRYLDEPPTPRELGEVARRLRLEPAALARGDDRLARELDLVADELTGDQWLKTLAEHPSLIQRPVVLAADGRAVLGRPPEAVLTLLGPAPDAGGGTAED